MRCCAGVIMESTLGKLRTRAMRSARNRWSRSRDVQTRRSLSSFSISSARPAHQVALHATQQPHGSHLTLTLHLTPNPNRTQDPAIACKSTRRAILAAVSPSPVNCESWSHVDVHEERHAHRTSFHRCNHSQTGALQTQRAGARQGRRRKTMQGQRTW